jgi:hypothetical protein
MKKKLTELHNLKAVEVSLVGQGANLKKRFPIFKQENNMDEEILKAVLETDVDEEAGLIEWAQKTKVSDKGTEAAQGLLRILSSFKDELSSDVLKQVVKAAGFEMPEEDKKKKKEKEKVAKPKEEEEEEMEAKKVKKELDIPDDVKEHFEAIQKAQDAKLEALTAQNEKVEKALKEEKDTRRLEHWVAKSKENLEFVPNKTAEELAVTFKKLEDVDPELAESHFEEMKHMSETVAKSALLEEMGSRGMAAGSVMEKIEKQAEIYRKNAKEPMSAAVAYDEYIQTPEGQKLYADYEQEKRN